MEDLEDNLSQSSSYDMQQEVKEQEDSYISEENDYYAQDGKLGASHGDEADEEREGLSSQYQDTDVDTMNDSGLASNEDSSVEMGRMEEVEQEEELSYSSNDDTEQLRYSDDVQEVQAARPSSKAGSVKVLKETEKYLLMLKSGKLQTQKEPRGTSAPAAQSFHSSSLSPLNLHDYVSPDIVANISQRSRKVLTPGPGAYELSTDRFGKRDGSKYSFGTARQRPPHVCIFDRVVSPGPSYLPQKEHVSTLCHVPRVSFPRQEIGTRYRLNASMPTNCAHWNPGPGAYDATTMYKGGRIDPNDGPSFIFPKNRKLQHPRAKLSAAGLLPEGKENTNVGPCHYDPDSTLVKPSIMRCSMAAKAPSYFDSFMDPGRQPSPGPIYSTAHINHRGFKSWGDDPRATFGKASKHWEPELNLSGTPFLSKLHAHHLYQTLYSPGPAYFPELPANTRALAFDSGPEDRFYSRFEPGRMV